MEKNTVTLSIEEYNELRDFKLNMENNNSYNVYVDTYWYNGPYNSSCKRFITNDENVKELVAINKHLETTINKLKDDHSKKLNEIKQMSIWAFVFWKKRYW